MASLPSSSAILSHTLNTENHVNVRFFSTSMYSIGNCQGIGRNGKKYRHCFRTEAKVSIEKDVLVKEPTNDKDDGIGVLSIHHVGLLCENLEQSLEFYQNLLGRPEHGGRDRHACIAIRDVSKLKAIFDEAGVPYTLSRSGRPAIFARDPDGNALEFTQVDS
uniref:VOC domain-containing protein n=1 Tax=Nelumbo nucifera TaxID=4432 RepID=A0A823A256_NELNU|nr:TPA_asm: hypothetical protein HUJ06_018982 [Nelumbo nucifera]